MRLIKQKQVDAHDLIKAPQLNELKGSFDVLPGLSILWFADQNNNDPELADLITTFDIVVNIMRSHRISTLGTKLESQLSVSVNDNLNVVEGKLMLHIKNAISDLVIDAMNKASILEYKVSAS